MVANDDAHSLAQRGALRFIASKLRSYGAGGCGASLF